MAGKEVGEDSDDGDSILFESNIPEITCWYWGKPRNASYRISNNPIEISIGSGRHLSIGRINILKEVKEETTFCNKPRYTSWLPCSLTVNIK